MDQGKPRLIKLGMVGSLVGAAFMPVFLVFALFGPEMGTYLINNQPVDRETFQKFFIANFLPFVVVSGPLLVAIAYGFWKDRPWSRHAAVSFWVVEGMFLMRSGGSGQDLTPTLIAFAIAMWYFYVRPNVVAYYRAIATKPGGPPVASSSS